MKAHITSAIQTDAPGNRYRSGLVPECDLHRYGMALLVDLDYGKDPPLRQVQGKHLMSRI